jgi:hypothetical protein
MRITSYQWLTPSENTWYEFRTFMLGYRLAALPSATVRSEMDLVNLDEPMAFCLLPETGLGFRAPPRRSLTLTMTIPGLALYPSRRAVGRLVGLSTRLMTGSRLQVIADFLSQSLNSGVLPCHQSAMYEYAM